MEYAHSPMEQQRMMEEKLEKSRLETSLKQKKANLDQRYNTLVSELADMMETTTEEEREQNPLFQMKLNLLTFTMMMKQMSETVMTLVSTLSSMKDLIGIMDGSFQLMEEINQIALQQPGTGLFSGVKSYFRRRKAVNNIKTKFRRTLLDMQAYTKAFGTISDDMVKMMNGLFGKSKKKKTGSSAVDPAAKAATDVINGELARRGKAPAAPAGGGTSGAPAPSAPPSGGAGSGDISDIL